MRFAVAIALLSASLAAAQSATTSASSSSSTCDAQSIVDACTAQYKKQQDACKANDWICLCDTTTNLLTCYNNCPDSADKSPVKNEVTQYCNAAAPLKSSSSASAASVAKTAKTTATSATTTGTATASGSGSKAASATAFNTGAAIAIGAPVSGAFAALLAALL